MRIHTTDYINTDSQKSCAELPIEPIPKTWNDTASVCSGGGMLRILFMTALAVISFPGTLFSQAVPNDHEFHIVNDTGKKITVHLWSGVRNEKDIPLVNWIFQKDEKGYSTTTRFNGRDKTYMLRGLPLILYIWDRTPGEDTRKPHIIYLDDPDKVGDTQNVAQQLRTNKRTKIKITDTGGNNGWTASVGDKTYTENSEAFPK